ncbi:MAG: MotA/TolQ/ExbB proton channel family protein [Trueperaceae bacterium]
MLLSLVFPLIMLGIFAVWMGRITWQTRQSLRQTDLELEQLEKVLSDLSTNRRDYDSLERWLGDTYAFIAKNSYSKQNPIIELINRFYAMRELAVPNIFAALDSISNRELDKLEQPRETPNTLLLLGLMGTVVGMVTALSTFAFTERNDNAALDIGRIIGAMFVAFISTGIALILSITTRNYIEKVEAHQSDMLSTLEGYAFTQLAPMLLPKQDRIVQQHFHNLMKSQQALLGESLEKSASTLSRFSSSVDQAQKVTQGLSDALTRNANALNQIGQRITSDLSAVSNEVSAKLLQGLQGVNHDFAKHRAGLESNFKEVKLSLEEEKRLGLQQTELLQRRMAETVDVLRENNTTLVKSFNTMTSHYATHTEKQTASIEALRQDVARLSERLATSQENYQKNFLQTIQEFIRSQFEELSRTLGRRK